MLTRIPIINTRTQEEEEEEFLDNIREMLFY